MKRGNKKNSAEGLGISGFTISVIAIIFTGYVGIVLSIVGLVFCLVQQKKNPTKLSKAGVILGIIGIVLSIIYIIVFFTYLSPLINSQFGGF